MTWLLPSDTLDTCSSGLLYCMSKWASDVTGGFFWAGILMSFQVVLFMATYNFGTPRSFGFAAVAGLLLGVFLAIAGLIPWWIGSIFILVGCVGFAALILNER